jgi:hypothetical protein
MDAVVTAGRDPLALQPGEKDRIVAAIADAEQRPDGSVLLGPVAVARIHELIALADIVRDESDRARAYGRLMGGVESLIGPPP